MKTTYIKSYEELTFADNFMFCEIMRGNPKLCKEVVETVLDVKIREIISIDKENTIQTSYDGHGVRLDVYVEGDEAIYDIEVQTHNEGNIKKRSRFYQGILDTDYLKKGEDYNELKKTFIIFICKFDLFGRGLSKYTFKNMCEEVDGLELEDEAIKVFINSRGTKENGNERFNELIKYIDEGVVGGELTQEIEKNLVVAKSDEGRRSRYMTFEWELAKARREGREEGRLALIEEMLKSMSEEQLASLGIPETDIIKAKALAGEKN